MGTTTRLWQTESFLFNIKKEMRNASLKLYMI
jgi:hypothetical protein